MDCTSVSRAVIAPPSPTGDSNDTALEAARRFPSRFAVMGRFNPELEGARERLQSWLQQPGMFGIRMTFYKPVWARWLAPCAIDWFWSDCETLGILISALAFGAVDQVGRLAARHPGLTIILDHLARRSGLRDDACFADLSDLLALARLPNVSVKATALPCYTTDPYPFANLYPHLRRIYDAFDPDRIMWGSDLTRLPCSYAQCLDHVQKELDFPSDADRVRILGGTAATLLRWPADADT
jgi:predicted TIM-barrel fold metal-dependent hydrolase